MLSKQNLIRLIILGSVACLLVVGCSKATPPADKADDAPAVEAPAAPEVKAPAAAEPTPVAPTTPAPEMAATPDAPAEDWLIVPGERVGKITAMSTEAQLIEAYGKANVTDAEFFFGEGESEMGTGLFVDDETKALRISWENPKSKSKPVSIQFSGTSSVWKTAEGISLGTPLTKVQEINGKPFKLFGFEWDYGGSLCESNDGAIKGLPHEDPEKGFQPVCFGLTFQPDVEGKPNYPQEKYFEVAGDTEFSSDHPVMQDLDPVVYSITVSFPEVIE